MPSTRHVLIRGFDITLYSLDGRNWFSSPILLLRTKRRLEAIRAELKQGWRDERRLVEREVLPVPDDPAILGGVIHL